MHQQWKALWAPALLLAFVLGVCCGAWFAISPANAQQSKSRENLTAQESFLQGGNTQVAVLRELLTATRENQARLEAIERNTAAMVQLLSPGRAPAPK